MLPLIAAGLVGVAIGKIFSEETKPQENMYKIRITILTHKIITPTMLMLKTIIIKRKRVIT